MYAFRPRPARPLIALGAALGSVALLAACSSGTDSGRTAGAAGAEQVTLTTNLGEKRFPKNPERVAALDNTSFATLKALGIKPVAAPKELLPATGYDDWRNDDSIADVGSHREPKLEELNAAEPDLIIGGYRFAEQQDELEKIAPTVDISPSDEAEGGYVASLKTQTEQLGELFGEEEQAAKIVDELESAEKAAIEATDGETVFLAVASGGKIDNGASRIGRLAEPLNLRNVLSAEGQEETSVHNDSGLAPETVAKLNPDWMIVMDRDTGVFKGEGEAPTPAKSLVKGQDAWKKTTFASRDQIVYLPADFYVTEGAQAYTASFELIAEAFAKAAE
ncbi:Petrobactin-binding protein YclQ [Streptomyces sp. enrichment culture]|uniref:siderophore ABC transporter substrate-binding protein n=1 Tax=Streptomyces sp. enrichment culture TaxID=1795815 RepID=UPI003F57DE43